MKLRIMLLAVVVMCGNYARAFDDHIVDCCSLERFNDLLSVALQGDLTPEIMSGVDAEMRMQLKQEIERRIAELTVVPLSSMRKNALTVGAYTAKIGMLASMLFAMYAQFRVTSKFHASYVAHDLAEAFQSLDDVINIKARSYLAVKHLAASSLLWNKMWKWVGCAMLSTAGFAASAYVATKCSKLLEKSNPDILQNLRNALEIIQAQPA